MGEELAAIIRQEIQEKGPIPFSRWMELCLYHPEFGYYMKPGRKTGAGRDADFVTPPTLHPFFGHALAQELESHWTERGRPSTFSVLEFGAGEGDLARNALFYLDAKRSDLARAISWFISERSASHRPRAGLDDRIQLVEAVEWGGGWFDRDRQAGPVDVVLGCEVLDAIPFDVLRFNKGWQSLLVDRDRSGFSEKWAGSESPPDWVWPETSRPIDGQQVIHHSFIGPWINDIPRTQTTLMLMVDYGQAGPIRLGVEAVRGYRHHEIVSAFDAPGENDITGSVDFAQAAFWSGSTGLPMQSLESLEQFLLRHGILEELNSIDRSTVEGASSYLRLRQLLLPTGMGAAFKVARFDRLD